MIIWIFLFLIAALIIAIIILLKRPSKEECASIRKEYANLREKHGEVSESLRSTYEFLNQREFDLTKVQQQLADLKADYNNLLGQKKSSEVRIGLLEESLAPLHKDFKYDSRKARFIGHPIDYIIFEDNEIVFLEVKTGTSRLSPTQRKIKGLVVAGKVKWDQLNIKHLKQ